MGLLFSRSPELMNCNLQDRKVDETDKMTFIATTCSHVQKDDIFIHQINQIFCFVHKPFFGLRLPGGKTLTFFQV